VSLTVIAPAKVNLTLEVLGNRPDGYHEIASLMQTIDLVDRVRIEPADRLTLVVRGDGAVHLPPANSDNLAMRAAVAMRDAAVVARGARIVLDKHIPAAMGLGGGSSDAAAVLRGLNQLWDLSLDTAALEGIAAGIGSDVPFFLHGGTAAVAGRGEVVKPLRDIAPLDLTLFVSDSHIEGKTGSAYATLAASSFTDAGRSRAAIDRLRRGETLTVADLYNAFDSVVRQLAPASGRAMDACRRAGLDIIACGSGPGFYALASRSHLHEFLLEGLERECGIRAIACRTLARNEALAIDEG
jgi:4-diphosphocytidyl-2-C-methyl-D-erythritol kinase